MAKEESSAPPWWLRWNRGHKPKWWEWLALAVGLAIAVAVKQIVLGD